MHDALGFRNTRTGKKNKKYLLPYLIILFCFKVKIGQWNGMN